MEVTNNGKYIFIVTGIYNGKTLTKEIEIEVNKYKSAVGIVKYDAGEWTQEEIEQLKELNLYDLNATHTNNGTVKADDETGLNLTFGGFTYKGSGDASIDGVITSRNQSINTNYDGWQILETEENANGKTYVKKIIHAGLPEQFVYCYVSTVNDRNVKYIMYNGTIMQNYNKTPKGNTINPRNWDMYRDKELDQKNMINNVHLFTTDEYYEVGAYNTGLGKSIVPVRKCWLLDNE